MPSTGTEAILINSDPTVYLPHRAPFLYIDRIIAREPGICATGEFAVPTGSGCFPPLLLLECMAQLGGIAAGQQQGEGGVLAAIRGAQLPAAVQPGWKYSVHARVVKAFGRLVQVEAEVRDAEIVIAHATLTLAIGVE